MKTSYTAAAVAIALLAIPAGLCAAETYSYGQGENAVCTSCPAPAYDRTPIYVQEANDLYTPPTCPPRFSKVDPWVKCGAFCAAGQLPVGWPYGWNAEYWLRPNSNY